MDSKERILESACKIFTAYGFTASSTTEIAKLAAVSQGMIFHYFTNKELLWSEVINRISQGKQLQSLTLPSFSLSYDMFLTEVIRSVVHLYHHSPGIPRLLAWHHLEQSHPRTTNILFTEEALREAFLHYQATGDIPESMNLDHYLKFFTDILVSIGYSPNIAVCADQNAKTYLDFFVKQMKRALC